MNDAQHSSADRAYDPKHPFASPYDDPDTDNSLAFDPAVLKSPVVIRGLISAAAVLLIALLPDRSATLLGDIAAAGLVLTGILTLVSTRRSHLHRFAEMLFGAALIALGVAFFFLRVESTMALGRLVAVTLVVVAMRSLYYSRQHHGGLALTSAILQIIAAILLWAFPLPLLSLILATIGFMSLGVTLIAIMQLSSMSADERSSATTLSVTATWFQHRAMPLDLRQTLYGAVIFEGESFGHSLARFFTLMSLAAVIASMGVITDSTAVVIGAMLIAPLMTPLMGVASSLAMGWPSRLRRMAFVAASGAVLAILIGLFLGLVLSDFVSVATNSQIQARITPTVLDLITAIAAGGAGAYGLSRADVSDSLPGVAIAISLVPPLTVVGICYASGEIGAGNGALLLFLTNAVAIMIVGAFTFVLTGIAPLAQSSAGQHRVRDAAITIGVLALVVMGGLFLNGRDLATKSLQAGTVTKTVNDWIGDTKGYSVDNIALDSKTIVIDLTGPKDSEMPSADDLANKLAADLGRSVEIEIRTTQVDVSTATATASG